MKAQQILDQLVDDLVNQIEAGAGDWSMPWRQVPGLGMPTNATTGKQYRGGNVVILFITQRGRNYSTAQWATYKQWQDVGAQVRKGERGTGCIRWVTQDDNDDEHRDDDRKRQRIFPVGFTVFNRDQVDGAPDLEEIENVTPPDANEWFAAIPARILWGRPDPCYVPMVDRIEMPAWDAFDSEANAHAILAHELAHWTGHPDRLNRTLGRSGTEYALEELTAELSAAFTCAILGIEGADRAEDHAAYLAAWCRGLRENPKILWTVANAAQAATDYLASFSDQLATVA